MAPPTLQVVRSVLHRQAHADALHALGPTISSFIGPNPNLSLKEAYNFGPIKLLDWIWYSSCTSVDDRASSGWTLSNFLRVDDYYNRFQFAETTEVAAERGDLAMLEWRVRDKRSSKRRKVIDKNGDAEAHSMMGTPSSGGHWVDWGDQPGRNIELSIYNGHAGVTRWFYDLVGHEITSQEGEGIIQSAFGGGDLAFAELVVPAGGSVLDYSAHSARPEVVERRLESQQLWGDDVTGPIIREWARSGQLELLKRVAKLYSPSPLFGFSRLNYWYAAVLVGCARGDLSMVQWLLEHQRGREISKDKLPHLICVEAQGNFIELMQYLYDSGVQALCQCGLVDVAFHSQLASLKWLVKYFRESVRSSSIRMVQEAASRGHLEILLYFHKTCKLWPSEACSLMNRAVRKGRLNVVGWLHEVHPEACSSDAIDEAATYGHLEVVEWLYQNTCTKFTAKAMDGAAANGHLETMKWLHQYGSGTCTVRAVETGAKGGDVQVACWLQAHFPSHKPKEGNVLVHYGDRFEMCLFLKTRYPHTITQTFVRELKFLLEGGYGKRSTSYLVDWLRVVELDGLHESAFDEETQSNQVDVNR